MGTDHEQNAVLQRPGGVDVLLLPAVAVLPDHGLLDHHPGLWELVFVVEEEVARLLVLHGQDVRGSLQLLDQQVSCSFGYLQDLQVTLLLGAAGEVSFDDLTAGVVAATNATSILLQVGGDLSITAHMTLWSSA